MTINIKSVWLVFLVTLLLLCIFVATGGGAPGQNSAAHIANETGNIAGFWRGIWHGMIVPFTFFISLFSNSIHFYEIHNSGGWYDLGFYIGFSLFWRGAGGWSRPSEPKQTGPYGGSTTSTPQPVYGGGSSGSASHHQTLPPK